MTNSNSIKIVFELHPSQDGYPPEHWEGMWATPLDGGKYIIDSIPFFVKGISFGDVVTAAAVRGELRFAALDTPSTNSTVRVLVYDLERVAELRLDLEGLGCDIEGTGIPGLLAVNIPREVLADVTRFIHEKHLNEVVDFEEGALRP